MKEKINDELVETIKNLLKELTVARIALSNRSLNQFMTDDFSKAIDNARNILKKVNEVSNEKL